MHAIARPFPGACNWVAWSIQGLAAFEERSGFRGRGVSLVEPGERAGSLYLTGRCPVIRDLQAVQHSCPSKAPGKVACYAAVRRPRPEGGGPFDDENQDLKRIFFARLS